MCVSKIKFYYLYTNYGFLDVLCLVSSVMYKQNTLKSDPEVFLDPNGLSDDGTISLAVNAFSEDGTIFAYGLSKSGSDWFEVHFKNVETGENYPEVLILNILNETKD